MPIVKRLRNFLARPAEARTYAWRNWLSRNVSNVAALKGTGLGGVFPAFLPDSHWLKQGHEEFEPLYRKFSAHNRHNNGADVARLWTFILNIKHVLDSGIEGDFAELGVWRGNTAAILAHYARDTSREVFLFDTYEGFPEEDMVAVDADKTMAFADTSVELVRAVIGDGAVERCHFIKGYFPGSITEDVASRSYAIVSLDCDLYEPMRAGLDFFYSRMPAGGLFLLHDYSSMQWNGAKKAIDEFCATTREHLVLIPDKSGSVLIRKRAALA